MDPIADKIAVFERHFSTRIVGIAECLADGFERDEGVLGESGFAILNLIIPYFDAIGQFIAGKSSVGDTKTFFNNGFKEVLGTVPPQVVYRFVRIGTAHDSAPRGNVYLDRRQREPYLEINGALVLNPAEIVRQIRNHLNRYLATLRDPRCETVKTNFATRYDELLKHVEFVHTGPPTGGTPPALATLAEQGKS